MRIREIIIKNKKDQEKIFKPLHGRVFHVTSLENYSKIKKDNEIKHNKDGELISNWTYESYFKNIGCVSFCDFKNNTDIIDLREMTLSHFPIFSLCQWKEFVFLFLNPNKHANLITWDKKPEGNYEKTVPYLESGYPGFIPLSFIEEALIIKSKIISI